MGGYHSTPSERPVELNLDVLAWDPLPLGNVQNMFQGTVFINAMDWRVGPPACMAT